MLRAHGVSEGRLICAHAGVARRCGRTSDFVSMMGLCVAASRGAAA